MIAKRVSGVSLIKTKLFAVKLTIIECNNTEKINLTFIKIPPLLSLYYEYIRLQTVGFFVKIKHTLYHLGDDENENKI